jgi:GntR family transcriptional regulator
VAEGDRVVRRRQVTSPAGEPPFQLADSWIHPNGVADAPRAAEPDTGPGGYLDRLEEGGHGPISWTEHVRARMPLPGEADLLQVAARAVVIEIARVGTSAKTQAPIEVTICVIPAERVEIITSLERGHTAQWSFSQQGISQARNGGQ